MTSFHKRWMDGTSYNISSHLYSEFVLRSVFYLVAEMQFFICINFVPVSLVYMLNLFYITIMLP